MSHMGQNVALGKMLVLLRGFVADFSLQHAAG